MKRSRTPSRLLASALLAALACAGCVTRGTYREVVGERDALLLARKRLADRVALLERSNESLDSERAELIDQMEDLRQQRLQLEHDVNKLKRTEELLSEHLRAREAELASRTAEVHSLHRTYEGLVQDLEAEVATGQIQIEQLREGLRVNVSQDILFPSGSARLSAGGLAVLRKVARQLAPLPNAVAVQGHTDDVPISTARFPSNWELAAARAGEVVRLLEREGVDPTRLRAVAYGEHHPVASNETLEGRAKNRRIEIRLEPVPEPSAAAEASAASPAP